MALGPWILLFGIGYVWRLLAVRFVTFILQYFSRDNNTEPLVHSLINHFRQNPLCVLCRGARGRGPAPRAPRAGPRSFNSQLWRIASMASREHDKQCTKCYNPMMARYSPDLISTEHRRNPGRCSSPSTHGCSHTEWGASHPQVHRLGNLGGRRGRATRAYFAGAASAGAAAASPSAGGGGGGGGGVFEPWLV